MIDYLQLQYGELEREVFSVILFETKHRLIDLREMFLGTVDAAGIYPREVVKTVLKHNAAAVAFVYNHPSGSTEPSSAGRSITKMLKDALALIDVRVLDHIIVSQKSAVSFAKQGLL